MFGSVRAISRRSAPPSSAERGVKIMGLSIDNVVSHEQWLHDIRDTHGVNVHFPIAADVDRSIAQLYGMLHPNHGEAFPYLRMTPDPRN
jgi:alkyl hydroperoxide reductase subunit AhpC